MGNVVALAALGETCQHGSGVRCTVAALAGRHGFVLVLVTGYAGNCLMLRIGLAVKLGSLLVARCAHFVGCVRSIGNRCRHMGLVAAFAVGSGHVGTVRLVALGTEWNLAMNIVAEAAGQLGMLAWNLLQLDYLLAVAGETLIGDVVGQFDDLRSVRVVVAAQTAGEFVVRLAAVALAAFGDDLLYGRRMACVAILATYTCLVSAAVRGNCFRSSRVTLYAIGVAQNRFGCIRGNGRQCRNTHQCGSHTKGFHKPCQALHLIPSCLVEYKPIHGTGFRCKRFNINVFEYCHHYRVPSIEN